VKLTVLYGNPEDPAAFEEYYAKTHMALVDKRPSFQRYEVARIIATPDGTETPYYRIFEIYFDGAAAKQPIHARRTGTTQRHLELRYGWGEALHLSEVDS
jgi:uncharacterized protein (TIGR02118 family)